METRHRSGDLPVLRTLGLAAAVFLLSPPAVLKCQTERGEYLATRVAMCVECHSPRDAEGHLIDSERFLGAPIPVQGPSGDWAARAPRIARIPGWTDEQFIHFLETGIRPDGTRPRRPMPPFRMNREDAAAIGQFLRSLHASR